MELALGGLPDRGFDEKQLGGWIYNILPYIEQGPLHDTGAGTGDPMGVAKMTSRMALAMTPLDVLVLSDPPPLQKLSQHGAVVLQLQRRSRRRPVRLCRLRRRHGDVVQFPLDRAAGRLLDGSDVAIDGQPELVRSGAVYRADGRHVPAEQGPAAVDYRRPGAAPT